jgi:hypothetical protein
MYIGRWPPFSASTSERPEKWKEIREKYLKKSQNGTA